MRFLLKSYQVQAVGEILERLERAREDHHGRGDLLAFALSATTGAGKTVMATAVLEALFEGSEDLEFDADPSAVVLWVTDDPSLNEQTRYRLIESGDALEVSQLNVIDSKFDEERFEPHNVYFLNVQKLGSATSWVKRNNARTNTLWDTIENTIADESRTLYVILDEAHRGMKSGKRKAEDEKTRSTIVQRLVNGDNGVPPVPIVWGISATVQRFADAMTAAQAEGRITYPPIAVDPKAVQDSGLLKDTIILDFPDEKGAFETTLLRSAVRSLRQSSDLWSSYGEQEGLSEPVLPLMVFQVPNKPREKDLAAMLDLIREEWPELSGDGIAHVFGEHTDLSLGGHTVPYIAPQDVEGATHVRILLAKDAISTGWDCPRAEVLFSLRPAKDRTHITQLLGRMVRTPLARRVESDERLNAVICFLPRFDLSTATEVAEVLNGEKIERDPVGASFGSATGRKALTSPVTMVWNDGVPADVRECLGALPSEAVPKGTTKPIKRLLGLAAEIAVDGLMDAPDEKAHDVLFGGLDGQMARHSDAVEKGVEEIHTAEIRRITSTVLGKARKEATYEEEADDRTVDDAFRAARLALGTAIANAYVRRLAEEDVSGGTDLDIHGAKAKLAALIGIEGVRDDVDAEADKAANAWLNRLRTKIRGLGEERRLAYDEVRQQARDPQRVEMVTPKSRIENTKDAEDKPLPRRKMHVLADEDGNYPVGKLNDWELAVLDTELDRDETAAWYRNPSSASADTLQIPYEVGDAWKPMRPDFVFFSKRQDGSIAASIVDPHGSHLSDALPKLLGMAAFAERYPNDFLRIEAVAEVGKKGLRMLDLSDPAVRQAVRKAKSAQALYESNIAVEYE